MPAFLEKKLKEEYGAKSDVPYKIMNAQGYMHGSKITAKGEEAEAKHEADSAAEGRNDVQAKPEGAHHPAISFAQAHRAVLDHVKRMSRRS